MIDLDTIFTNVTCRCPERPNPKDWILFKCLGEQRDICFGEYGEYEEYSYQYKIRCPKCGELAIVTVSDNDKYSFEGTLIKGEQNIDSEDGNLFGEWKI